MQRRRVTAPFILVTTEIERKFEPGEVIEGELADHWYSRAHSEPIPALMQNSDPKPRRKAS